MTGLLIGLAVGAAIGFGATVYADYADDGEVFNGSIETKDYVLNTLFGGLIGSAAGLAAPYIASFAASSFTLSFPTGFAHAGGGASAIAATITGAQILAGVGSLAALGIMYMIPKHGTPNTKITSGGSYGEYDSNGNLKSVGRRCLPHIHKFTWKLIDGIWRFVEEVLPYIK